MNTPMLPENVTYMIERLDALVLKPLVDWGDATGKTDSSVLRTGGDFRRALLNLRKDLERTHRPHGAANSRFVVPGR